VGELLGLETDTSMKLHFEPLAGIWLDPLAVDALVFLTGPGILELVQLEAFTLQAFQIRPDTLSVASLALLKGVTDRVRHSRHGFFRGVGELLHLVADLFFDAVTVFEAVLEADEVAVRILAFDGAHRG